MKSSNWVLLLQCFSLLGCNSLLGTKSRTPASSSTQQVASTSSTQIQASQAVQGGVSSDPTAQLNVQPIPFSGSLPQSEVFGDFSKDANGFGRWTALNSVLGTRLLCRNGSVEAIRTCNDPGNSASCIGPVERIASCAEFGIQREEFSAWSAWKPVSECVNGRQNFTRSCVSLDGLNPVCYGQSSANLACSAERSASFTRMGECGAPPSSYAFDQYYVGCGGIKFYYNGVRTTQTGCKMSETGSVDCSQAVTSTQYCMRPGTVCGTSVASNPASYVPGTIYSTPEGSSCGISLASITTPENKISAFAVNPIHEISSYSLACGAANHVFKNRTCKKNTGISDCQVDVLDIVAGKQNDTSCDDVVTGQIESCSYSSVSSGYLTQLRRNGVWSAWEQASGCAFIPSLNQVARLEVRKCGSIGNNSTELDGLFCEGERTRFVSCSGVLDGNRLLILHSNALGSAIQSKLNQYAEVVRGKGADVTVVSQSASLSVAELRAQLSGYVLPSGQKPNSVLLVGAFPHAKVFGPNASSQVGNIYSDLPYSTPLAHYVAQADGSYVLASGMANQPVVVERAIFWLDLSNHTALVSPYTNSESKYVAFLDRMIQGQQSRTSLVTLNKRAKMNQLVDGYWDNQPYHISNNKADITSFIGTSRSGGGGFAELLSKQGDLAAVMVHGNGMSVNLAGKSYLPSNDSLDSTVNAVGSNSLLSGIAVQSAHLNLYSCYSGDPSVPNNVMYSALLNPQAKAVSALASTTSGALDNWTGYRYYDKLALGHSAAASYLHFMNANRYGTFQMMAPYRYESVQTLGPKWFTGLILSGDPLYQVGEAQAD